MRPKSLSLAALVAIHAIFLSSCSTVPQLENPQPISEIPIWDGETPAFCIALSGGGIRSGATSLGVLQALQERNMLSNANIISTVSGGGYPVYGLVAAKEQNRSATLDELLSDGGKHISTSEETVFIDTFDGAYSAVMGALRSIGMYFSRVFGETPDLVESASVAFPYASEIHDTFVGYSAPVGRGISLIQSADPIEGLGLPYWIIQTSASDGIRPPSNTHKYDTKDVFELSRDWIGSDSTGYMRSFIPRLTLMDSMVASAAAIDTPRTSDNSFSIPDWAKKLGFGLGAGLRLQDGRGVFLSDGGFIDNQAVIPLLRRNCRTILALDASHDPAASMKGWEAVGKYLESTGWNVTKPKFVNHNGGDSLSISAWNLPSHLYEMHGTNSNGMETTIVVMKLGISPSELDLYPPVVREFWQEQLAAWQDEPRCEGEQLHRRCTFPQQATATQNFSPKEFRAYRCLGHHLVQDYLAYAELDGNGTPVKRLVSEECRSSSRH